MQNVLKSLDIEALHGILVYFHQLQSDKEMVSVPAAVVAFDVLLLFCCFTCKIRILSAPYVYIAKPPLHILSE